MVLSFWTGSTISFQGSRYYLLDRYYNIDHFNDASGGQRLNKLGLVFYDNGAGNLEDVNDIMKGEILQRIEDLQAAGEDPYMPGVDAGHTKGHNYYTVTAGDQETLAKVDLSAKEQDKSWWSWIHTDDYYAQDVTIPALQLVDLGAFNWQEYFYTQSAIADEYFIDESYVKDLAAFVSDNSTLLDDLTGSSVFMMH